MTNALFRNRARRSTEEGEVTNALFSQPRARIHRGGGDQRFVFAIARADPRERCGGVVRPTLCFRSRARGSTIRGRRPTLRFAAARADPTKLCGGVVGMRGAFAAARADPTLCRSTNAWRFRSARCSGISYDMFSKSY